MMEDCDIVARARKLGTVCMAVAARGEARSTEQECAYIDSVACALKLVS